MIRMMWEHVRDRVLQPVKAERTPGLQEESNGP